MSTQLASLGTTSVRRWLSFVATAAILGGLLALGSAGPVAQAAADSGSAVAVKWAGGNDPAIQKYQPSRDGLKQGFVDDFKNLKVSVDQTKNLQDQTVTVGVEGMAPTVNNSTVFGDQANNYVQLMQCWGPDPLAADFATTCQWGSTDGAASGSTKTSPWSRAGAGASDVRGRGGYSTYPATATMRGSSFGGDEGEREGVRFKAAYGGESMPQQVPMVGWTNFTNGLAEFFSASTSNEIPIARVNTDGIAEIPFQTQTAAAAPHLGCGDAKTTGSRCWLVVVPRGEHYGGKTDGTTCVPEENARLSAGGYSGPLASGEYWNAQVGSPISPACSYWDHRIVIPLDFQPAFTHCQAGAAERRLTGSELAVGALLSWQSALCTGASATLYSFTTNSGLLNRGQLLQGTTGLTLTTLPVADGTVPDVSRPLLETADIGYAPVLNTALVLAVVGDHPQSGLLRDVKLTPRLVAKLLTQQYATDVPHVQGKPLPERPDNDTAGSVVLGADPEWIALNGISHTSGSSLAVLGPKGDDAIRLLWQWIQADEKAAVWLAGEPDNIRSGDEGNLGLTVNSYYLPTGHSKALGGGLAYDLSKTPIDTVPRADQTVYPESDDPLNGFNGQRVDSVTLLPYAGSFEETATRVLRTDAHTTDEWDPQKMNGPTAGAFVPRDPIPPGLPRLVIGPTGAENAHRYGITAAALQLPNKEGTFVAPTDATMMATLSASRSDEPGAATVDFARLANDAYPLTTTINAAVNFSIDRDATTKTDFATFLRFAAGDGQKQGTLRGQLPPGYIPLTDQQRTQTLKLANRLDGVPGQDPPAPAVTGANPSSNASDGVSAGNTNSPSGNSPQTSVSGHTAVQAGATTAMNAPSQAVLGGTLLAGVAGAVAAPFLLRRKGTGG